MRRRSASRKKEPVPLLSPKMCMVHTPWSWKRSRMIIVRKIRVATEKEKS
jgi:hypothetical protein